MIGEHVDAEQGSAEWLAARLGSVGATAVATTLAKGRGGAESVTRRKLLILKATERLTGKGEETYTNAAMAWGTEQEPLARAVYADERDVEVVTCGLFRHPVLPFTHASPDGLVGDDGLIEIKCPLSTTHSDTIFGGQIPTDYIIQMQWQMECAGRQWCDFVSFDPRFPPHLQLFYKRVERDNAHIAELVASVQRFNGEVETMMDYFSNWRQP